jgi:hypothetical protein
MAKKKLEVVSITKVRMPTGAGFVMRRGSVYVEFSRPTPVYRVAIAGDLNLSSVQLHHLPKGDTLILGKNIRTKQGWDSGTLTPVLAKAISLVGRRKQKGKKTRPSKVKEIVILKETRTRK